MDFTQRKNLTKSRCEIQPKHDVKESSYLKNLKEHILPRSEEKSDFDIAKLEWQFVRIKFTKEMGKCPCGHAIKEHCYIKNRLNQNVTHVGNECIKKFMNMDAAPLFYGLHKINNDQTAKPNRALIEYAYKKAYLHDNQHRFLLDIRARKRELTVKQKKWLRFINNKILGEIVVRRLPD